MLLISHAGALEETKKLDGRRFFTACLLFTVQDTLDLADSGHFGGEAECDQVSLLSVSVKSTQYSVREFCTLADQAPGASFL